MVRAVTNSVHTITHLQTAHQVIIGVFCFVLFFNFPETLFKGKGGLSFKTLKCATKKIYFENYIVNKQ